MSMSTLECHSALTSSSTNAASSSSSALNSFSISCSSSSFEDVLSPHSSSLPSLSPPLSAHNNNNYYLDYGHHQQPSSQQQVSSHHYKQSPSYQQDEPFGSCELNQDPSWPKMNAVVSGVAKKRKKPDIKPQSQIAKCLNEKRRREQENNYIEELAELISAASFAESMSSLAVKPDKCAILQETVNQIRNIKQQESSSDAVQQGEVSSSKPTVITNEVLGPLLLEALEGFLFVVNPDGFVDFCTENIKQFIHCSREDVLGKSVYNIIHHGDHARFHNCLVPSSHVSWSENSSSQNRRTTNRTFNLRLLIKPPEDHDQTMEEKQQRVCKYENMQISSTHLTSSVGRISSDSGDDNGEVSSEGGPCLMCVARRIPANEKQLSSPIEQFTMKLDRSGTVVGVDLSGVSNVHTQYLSKDLKGRRIQDLCHSHDLNKLSNHLNETITQGQSSIPYYRLRVASDKYIHIQTKSKLFRANTGESDFIMATNSIINENDIAIVMETVAQHNLGSNSHPSSASSGIGGPMLSSINGTTSTSSSVRSVVTSSELNNSSPTFQSFPPMEFEYFPDSNWEVDSWMERPESRHSEPTQSPLNSYQPSPAPNNPPSTPFPNSFAFSPLQQISEENKDSKEGVHVIDTVLGDSDNGRLRSALLQRPTSIDSDEGSNGKQKNQILKVLLNPGDSHDMKSPEEDVKPGNNNNNNNNNSNSNNNNMLLTLLNTKPDDDTEARAGLIRKNELLSQLLKEDDKSSSSQTGFTLGQALQQNSLHLNSSYKNIFKEISSSPSSPELLAGRPRKRPSEESDDGNSAKRPVSILDTLPSPGPSSNNSGNSELQKKNKMLASLLAQEPKNAHQPVPPIPADIISATPQEKLPRVMKHAPAGWSGGTVQQQNAQSRSNNNQHVRTQVVQQGQIPRNQFVLEPRMASQWDPLFTVDTTDSQLSDILDSVFDIVPDEVVSPDDQSAVVDLLQFIGSTNNTGKQNLPQEQAIKQIQKSLMQWSETTLKPPSYNVNQQAQHQASSQQQVQPTQQLSHLQHQQQYPPPPVYQQRPRFSIQQTSVRSGSPQFSISNQRVITPQMLQHRQKMIQQQQQQKQRLLHQQLNQVIPPSHVQAEHNMDALINNTVAPNVSLQRSVPDSPSSYLLTNSNSNGQMSPRSQTNNYQSSFTNGLRVSPNNGGSGVPSPFQQAQLSPRVSQPQQSQPSYSQNSWPQQSQVSRLSLQQQQNPMLSAQLTGNTFVGTTRASFISQQQQPQQPTSQQQRLPNQQPSQQQPNQLPGVRSLTSPGARHSPFPPEVSPNTATSYQASQFRMQPQQRTAGPQTPTATTHVPGASLRHYNNALSPHNVYSPDQSPSPYCYDSPPLSMYNSERNRISQMAPGNGPGGGTNNGVTDYVRQELRAIVGARQQGPRTTQQIQVGPGQCVSTAELEELGLSYEMPPGGHESPKMWASMGSDMNVTSPPNRTVENNSNDQKASLLQKLLSE